MQPFFTRLSLSYRCGFSPHPPHVYPEALWTSIFAQLRAKQPKGPLYLVGDDSYDSLHLSDDQIQKKATTFKMNAPLVAISREMDLVKKTLQSQCKIQFKAILEDKESDTHKIFTRPAF